MSRPFFGLKLRGAESVLGTTAILRFLPKGLAPGLRGGLVAKPGANALLPGSANLKAYHRAQSIRLKQPFEGSAKDFPRAAPSR
jgi:hypothetical protein